MKYLIIIIATVICFFSCKKDEFKTKPNGSFTVVNAVLGGPRANFNVGNISDYAGPLSAFQKIVYAGENNVYVWPLGDSLHPYYTNSKLNIQAGDYYSLFLSGSYPSAEAMLVKETIPYYTDSVAGLRFVNLSPNSTGINITRPSTPTVNVVANLQYKQMTSFAAFPAGANVADTFQFRNASTNAVLSTVTFSKSSIPRFRSVSLVFNGIIGGTPAPGVIQITHDR